MQDQLYDICIIGGGINGIAIANDAAGRGLKVILCEQNDLGSLTSSASTKLIHGGLRYLEFYEFSLVRKSLREREILLQKAPHLIYPLEFVMPHNKALRPIWMIRAGLFLYDHLAKRRFLKKSRLINLAKSFEGQPLKPSYKKAFSYFDCWVDDARLVITNAIQARENHAAILPRCKVIKTVAENTHWLVSMQNQTDKSVQTIQAKVLINATGPMINKTLMNLKLPSGSKVSLIKGSHLIVRQLFTGEHAYILQNKDGRIIFAIPYEKKFTLIGTTDVNYEKDFQSIKISAAETQYLLTAVNTYFQKQTTENDIVSSYAGIRALQQSQTEDLKAITRDYHLELIDKPQQPILLNVFGGKLTTHRELAEKAIDLLTNHFANMQSAWTQYQHLPGGNIKNYDFQQFFSEIIKIYGFIPKPTLYRYARAYGTRIHELLKNVNSIQDLGVLFGADLYQCEVEYLIENEWAMTVEDILWRRTKTGLLFSENQQKKLFSWLEEKNNLVSEAFARK